MMCTQQRYLFKTNIERGKNQMGGSSYSRPSYSSSTRSTNRRNGSMSSSMSSSVMTTRVLHKDMDPKNRSIICTAKSPVLIGLDVTGSNIDFARVVYDKAPMFHGQIEHQKYLNDFMINFSAIGDAFVDYAPLQIAEFQYGIDIDPWIKKLYLEEGGGGQVRESYELFAYYVLNHCEISNAELPFCFIIGDEKPYLNVDLDQVKDVIGDSDVGNITSETVFKDLMDKFKGNLFLLLNKYFGGGQPDKDEEIYQEWCNYIPSENIIRVSEEKGIIDNIRGIIAMVSKSRTLEEYQEDLASLTDPITGVLEPQTSERIKSVGEDLSALSNSLVVISDTNGILPRSTKKRKSGAKRL